MSSLLLISPDRCGTTRWRTKINPINSTSGTTALDITPRFSLMYLSNCQTFWCKYLRNRPHGFSHEICLVVGCQLQQMVPNIMGLQWRKTNPQPWWLFTPSLNINESTNQPNKPNQQSPGHPIKLARTSGQYLSDFWCHKKKKTFHSFPKVEWQRGTASYQYPIESMYGVFIPTFDLTEFYGFHVYIYIRTWIADMDVETCMTFMANHLKWFFLVGHVGSSKSFRLWTFALMPFWRHLDLSCLHVDHSNIDQGRQSAMTHPQIFMPSNLISWSQLPSGLCSTVSIFRSSSSAASNYISSSSLRVWFPCLWKEALLGEYFFRNPNPPGPNKTCGPQSGVWKQKHIVYFMLALHPRILQSENARPLRDDLSIPKKQNTSKSATNKSYIWSVGFSGTPDNGTPLW